MSWQTCTVLLLHHNCDLERLQQPPNFPPALFLAILSPLPLGLATANWLLFLFFVFSGCHVSEIRQQIPFWVWFLSCAWALPCCLCQSFGGLDCRWVSCSLDIPLFLYPSSTRRALELFLGHISPRVSKCPRNRRSDSSLEKAVCGLVSPDSASECEVTWKTNWQLAVKSKTHVQPHALVHLRIHSSCSVLLKDT